MTGNYIPNLFKGTSAYGLQIWVTSENTHIYNLVAIRRKGNEFKALKTFSFNEITELRKCISVNKPLFINIDGKGVLYKKFKLTEDDVSTTDILPSAKLDDFYLQTIKLHNDEVLACIARRDFIDSVISEFNSYELFAGLVIIGPVVYVPFISQINDTQFQIPHYKITLLNGNLASIERFENNNHKYDSEISFSDDTVLSEYFAAFNTVVIGLSKINVFLQSQIGISNQILQHRMRKIFHITKTSVPVVISLVLLTNFFLLKSYSKKNRDVENQLSNGRNLIEEIQKLETEISNKEQFIFENIDNSNGIISFYCDQIASQVPHDIKLLTIVVYPQKKDNRVLNKDPEFDQNQIIVTGMCLSSSALSSFIKSLNSFSWVDKIDIINYVTDVTTNDSQFKLKVSLKGKWISIIL